MADFYLFRDVMDKGLVDRNGDKMGKVDELLLELRPGELPAVRTIVLDHGSLLVLLPTFLANICRWIEERILGLTEIEPIEIPWERVESIDVVVHVDVDRQQVGATQTEEALWERYVSKLPWARR